MAPDVRLRLLASRCREVHPPKARRDAVRPRDGDVVSARRGTSRRRAVAAPPVLKLPDTVVPIEYDLRLTLDPDADDYSGAVEIRVRVAEPTDIVWINATRLRLLDARVVRRRRETAVSPRWFRATTTSSA